MACAAALASWDIIDSENLLEHVLNVGPYFQQQLQLLRDIPIVGNVRGHGLMAAVEMTVRGENEQDLLEKDYAIGELVDKHCQKLGLLVRPFIKICIISPPNNHQERNQFSIYTEEKSRTYDERSRRNWCFSVIL